MVRQLESPGMSAVRVKTEPKDVFLHLLAIITLYASAVSFGSLLFDYINLAFPDALRGDYYVYAAAANSIRWSISMLVIVFPVYVFTTWFLHKGYAREPFRKSFRIRKWLVYLTLFIAALVIIGDFVGLIYNFLGGELTMRFFLKIFAVFFIAASMFIYYFWDMKRVTDA